MTYLEIKLTEQHLNSNYRKIILKRDLDNLDFEELRVILSNKFEIDGVMALDIEELEVNEEITFNQGIRALTVTKYA